MTQLNLYHGKATIVAWTTIMDDLYTLNFNATVSTTDSTM